MKKPLPLFYFGGGNFSVDTAPLELPALSVILLNRLHSILKESKTSTSIIPGRCSILGK